MSVMKMDSFCNKFQANIFNTSKCQNCFKSRERHLGTNEDLNQAKPIYGGWLCLAPEGTDFGNPAQRSRKWQRRFFLLYEHGSLHFALDESPNTLPQGTVNMNLCTDVVDAETKTGQRNALCIITPDQEFYIRGENKDIINGWSEQLVTYPLTNKQNRKKAKSKVMPSVARQVPESDKPPRVISGTSDYAQRNSGQEDKSPKMESGPDLQGGREQDRESDRKRERRPLLEHMPARDQLDSLPSSGFGCLGKNSPPLPSPGFQVGAFNCQRKSEVNANNCADSHTVTPPQSVPASAVCVRSTGARMGERRQEEPVPVPEKSEVWKAQTEVHVEDPIGSRKQTRPGPQLHPTQRLKGPDVSCKPHSPVRSAQSPDPRSSESVMTPDLLNFKKGWLMILEEQNQWKKNWFVLSTHKLRFYRDSVAEEASELVGEMDLTSCHQVTEHQVQRNYGFQIHTQTQVHTLAAVTAGIRRNWIQALAKNVRPSNAPDVTNLSDGLCPFESSTGSLPEPDLTRDSLSPEVSAKMRHVAKTRGSQKRREGGHSKACGGAALRSARRSPTKGDNDKPTEEMWSVERRRRRREERRKRYEIVMGSVLELGSQEDNIQVSTGTGTLNAHQASHEHQRQRAQEIEERWQQVEKAGVREEKRVPLYPDTQAKDVGQLERLLHNYKRRVEELTAQLAGSTFSKDEQSLDQPMDSTWDFPLENGNVQGSEETPVKMDSSPYRSHLSSLTHKYKETKELLRLEVVRRHQMQGQLSFAPSTADQCSLSLCDTLDNRQGCLASDTVCPELLEHFSLTGFEELCPSSAEQVRQCPSQSKADNQGNSDLEKLLEELANLSHQNEALNQQNQEMVHQLTEADREIERLRAKLDARQDGQLEPSALEKLTSSRVEDLENELRKKCLELQAVQAQLSAQSEKLRDALSQLHLKETTLEGLGFLACMAEDHRSHAPLQKTLVERLEDQLDYTEFNARDAQGQKACTPVMSCCQRDEVIQSQVPLDVEETQNCVTKTQATSGLSPEEVGIQCLMDEIQVRSKAFASLFKGTGQTDLPTLVPSLSARQDFDTNRLVTDRLHQEQEIWATLLNCLKGSPLSLCDADGFSHGLTAEVAGARLEEIKLYLSAHKHYSPPINSAIVSETHGACQAQTNDGSVLTESGVSRAETAELTAEVPEQHAERILNLYKRFCKDSLWRELRASVNLKASLLKCIASNLDSSVNPELQCTVQDLCSLWHRPADLEFINIQAVGPELLLAYIVSRLEAVGEKYAQTEVGWWGSEESCQNCQVLRQKNYEQCNRLQPVKGYSRDEEFLVDSSCTDGAQVNAMVQEGMMNPPHDDSSDQIKTNMPKDLIAGPFSEILFESQTVNKADDLMAPVNGAPERESVWPSKKDLTGPSWECNGEISALQKQYRREFESLEAACEQGFEAMAEAHKRALAELHLQHQRELALCQQDKEQLLAEETAATVIAIEAIKKAHQEELEKVLQGQRLGSPGKDVEEILKRHSEELCSTQRELDVLSQQYSLKCLESAHLAQALEAERHALQQCQRHYQEISIRHQELCGDLARENILSSPLSKDAPVMYELQIGLRVKQAQVDCLKQEICSLKEELQTAQRDKRYAAERCTDMHKELSTTKAGAQRDIEELREHLTMVYKTLETSSAEKHLDVGDKD